MRVNKRTLSISIFITVLMFLSTTQVLQVQAQTWYVTKTIPYETKGYIGFDYLEHGGSGNYVKVKMVSYGNSYAEVTYLKNWWKSEGWVKGALEWWELDEVKIQVTLKVGSITADTWILGTDTNDRAHWIEEDTQIEDLSLKIYGSGQVYVDVTTWHKVNIYEWVWWQLSWVFDYSFYRVVDTGYMYCGVIYGWV